MTDTLQTPSYQPPRVGLPAAETLRRWARQAGVVGKAAMVAALALAMLVPLGLVQGVITERSASQRAATEDIRALWGDSQRIAGPLLRIPYRTQDTGTTQLLWVLPDIVTVNTRLVPELRYRDLYQTVVYRAEIDIAGSFPPLARAVLGERTKRIDWNEASLALGITDPRSLLLADAQRFAGSTLTFEPGAEGPKGILTLGAAVSMLGEADPGTPLPFRFSLRLNGSGEIAFLALSRRTEVAIGAPWPAPSFFGRFAPEERQIDNEGFAARWQVAHLGTGLPQVFDSYDRQAPDMRLFEATRFGVALMQPVGAHRESERAAKYGILFVALTLGLWLLFELAAGVRVHPLQYGVVGAALCVFYLLLLSLAEHLGFATAYALSAAAIVLQTSAYTRLVTRGWRLTAIFAAAVAGLYGYLYVLLQLETLSLIGGSVLLFGVLSLAMWGTRRLGASGAALQARAQA